MSRRGTVTRDTSGRWMFVVDIAPEGAPRRQVRRRGFKRKTDALEALNTLLKELRDGTYVPKNVRDADGKLHVVTVGEFVDEWLPAIRTTVEASTWDSYDRMLRNHGMPKLGAIPLQSLEPSHLNALYAELLVSGRRDGHGGLSARTIRYLHTIVHRMLRDATRWGRAARNVASLADPPSAKAARAPEMRWWTPQQLRDFLAQVAEEPLFASFRLAAMTGLRRGEVYGLLWRDVDLDAGKLTVQRQLRTIRGQLDHVEITKSSAGRRTIDLDPGTVTALRAWRKQQLEHRLLMGNGYRDELGFVFTEPGGAPVDPDSAAKVFQRRVASSDLPRIRFHDLRHTHAVHLIAAGQHVKVVSERLGHASTSFTMDRYGHVMPNLQSDAASAVAALVDG
jgi:integrase